MAVSEKSALSENVKKRIKNFKSWDETCYCEFQTQTSKQSKQNKREMAKLETFTQNHEIPTKQIEGLDPEWSC